MSATEADLKGIKEGVAVLTTVLVSVINDLDPIMATNFRLKLELAYAKRRDTASKHEQEMLSWVKELITGFNPVSGPGDAFIDELGGRAVALIDKG